MCVSAYTQMHLHLLCSWPWCFSPSLSLVLVVCSCQAAFPQEPPMASADWSISTSVSSTTHPQPALLVPSVLLLETTLPGPCLLLPSAPPWHPMLGWFVQWLY